MNEETRRNLTRPYMQTVVALGAVAAAVTCLRLDASQLNLRFALLTLATVSFGSHIIVRIPRVKSHISVSDTFVLLAVWLFGGEAGILLAALDAYFISRRTTVKRLTLAFNVSVFICSTFVTVWTLRFIFGPLTVLARDGYSSHFVVAICVMAFTQYVVNSGLVAAGVGLKAGAPLWRTWRENFLWTSLTYFAGASAAGIIAKLVGTFGLYAFLATAPIIAVVYFTYTTYLRNVDDARRHVEELSRQMAEQERISRALRESEEHFRSAFDYAAVGMALVATDGRWLQVNRSLCKLVGYAEQELLRTNFQSITHPEDLGSNLADLYQMLEGRLVTSTREKRYIHKDGHVVWATVSASSVFDEQGRPMHFILQAQDITERKRAEEQLHRAAFYDALTGLPNRVLFTDHLTLAVNRARQHPEHLFAVLFLDIDRFKNVNDSLGHAVGDQLLTAVARRLQDCVRPEDTVSRFGGDEFAVLLNGVKHPADALAVTERILRAIEAPFRLSGFDVFTSSSVGVALSTTEHRGTEEILRDADTAMYRAKEQGKGRFEVFDKVMHARALSRLQLESDLRQAVEREEFEVYYQPIVNLETGGLSGFEALLRWHHPERGLVMPADFIPVAEDTELIIPIGNWLLHEACRQVREWQAAYPSGEPLTISVNLSSKQFKQPNLVGQVKQALYRTGLDPRCLRLEITESMVMEDAEAATAMLRQLRSLDVQLSIDDFGTGYSSLSYLHRFPVNILKIDRSFVCRMSLDEESMGIVETIVTLASKLKMDVVAEGIETAEQWEKLKALSCHYGQGYLFSPPVPAAAAHALVGESRPAASDLVNGLAGADEVELINGAYSM